MRALILTTFLAVAIPLSIPLPASAAPEIPAATPESKDKSRAAFKKGVAQLRAQDWLGARNSFEAAWLFYSHPSILLNLGISRLKTGDPVLAEADFVRFLSEDFGASPDELASAREALAEARASIGTLKLTVMPTTASVTVDGAAVQLSRKGEGLGADLHVKGGSHTIITEATGFEKDSRDVNVAAKAEEPVTIELKAIVVAPKVVVDQGMSTRHIVGWSLAGFGGAALITGGFLGIRAKSIADDYNDSVARRQDDADLRSKGMTYRTGADVMFGVAILSAAAAAVLLLTDLGDPKESRAALLHW